MAKRIKINRAPVLTLWAAVVAERLGYEHATALTLRQLPGWLSCSAFRRIAFSAFLPRLRYTVMTSAPMRLSSNLGQRSCLLGLLQPEIADFAPATMKDPPAHLRRILFLVLRWPETAGYFGLLAPMQTGERRHDRGEAAKPLTS